MKCVRRLPRTPGAVRWRGGGLIADGQVNLEQWRGESNVWVPSVNEINAQMRSYMRKATIRNFFLQQLLCGSLRKPAVGTNFCGAVICGHS